MVETNPAHNWQWQRASIVLDQSHSGQLMGLPFMQVSASASNRAYAYVDDVSVTPCVTAGCARDTASAPTWTKSYRFNGQLLGMRSIDNRTGTTKLSW